MDNDLFTATETLNNAFGEVLKNEKNKGHKWGLRDQIKRLKQAIEQRNLTVSEKLLLCYGSGEELFPSREGKKKSEQEFRKKALSINDEFLRLFEELRALPKEEQERINKELDIHRLFSTSVTEPSKDNTKTAFEHNKNKGKKNGK